MTLRNVKVEGDKIKENRDIIFQAEQMGKI